MDDSHTKSVEEVINYFKTDETTGLSDDQVKRAQEKYGPNGEYTIQFGINILSVQLL